MDSTTPVTEMGIVESVARSISASFGDGSPDLAKNMRMDWQTWEPEARAAIAALSTRTHEAAPDYAALAEKCAVACYSEAFPSTATYETRIEKVLRENLSRTPEAAQVERELIVAYMRHMATLRPADANGLRVIASDVEVLFHHDPELNPAALAQVRHPLEKEG